MELYNRYKLRKKKYYKKAFSNSNISSKYSNDGSFRNIQPFNEKLSLQKSDKDDISLDLNKYNLRTSNINYRNKDKNCNTYYSTRSHNHINLRKKNFIKIHLNYKNSLNNNNKKTKKDQIITNKSLSERIKNKTLDKLLNSAQKINKKENNIKSNKSINKNENIAPSNFQNELTCQTSSISSPKTSRKKMIFQNNRNNDNNNDLEKNMIYFNELHTKIKDLQERIKVTKKNLYISLHSDKRRRFNQLY